MRRKAQPQKSRAPKARPADVGKDERALTSRSEQWFRVLAAVVIPVGLLLVLEALLHLIGYGYSPGAFKEVRQKSGRVRIENRDFGRRFFPPGLIRYPQPLTLATPKVSATARVFVLGESAAMGDPDFKFGLPRMLEVLLRERFPNRRFEVINVAMVAINSHVILPLARDCVGQQGDLWVVYMGNNEVIGPFGSASIFGAQAPPLAVVRAGLWLKTTKLGQLLEALLQRVRQGSHALPEWNGMEMMSNQKVSHNSSATRRVYQHFERNLKDLLRTGTDAGVPIILCTVATNLKDCAPFASLHRTGLAGEELRQWQKAYDAGRALEDETKWQEAESAYERAAQIDSEFAELDFRRGQCCALLGRDSDAAQLFRQAREKDALQFRADDRINDIIRQCGREFIDQGVRVLDADQMFSDKSPRRLSGREFFYEHVHLTPEGNYLLAQAVAQSGVEALRLQANSGWASMDECFDLLGLTDWNRYDAFNVIYNRIQGAPFANQANHAWQLDYVNRQLQRYKMATKPAELRQEIAKVARLVTRFPRDPDLRWNLAALLQNSGDAPDAQEQWRALMDLQPQSPFPIFNLAKLLDTLPSHQNEAFTLYNDCLRLDPDSYETRFALGALCLRTGRLPEAIRQLKLAMQRRPDAIEAKLASAEALARFHDAAGAEKQLREVLRLDPQNGEARQLLAELHHP